MIINIEFITDQIDKFNRIFPRPVVKEMIAEHQQIIDDGRAVGVFVSLQPDNNTHFINLNHISHIIQSVKETEKGFNFEIDVLDTPHGLILQQRIATKGIECFYLIFRAMGNMNGHYVTKLTNITSIDICEV